MAISLAANSFGADWRAIAFGENVKSLATNHERRSRE